MEGTRKVNNLNKVNYYLIASIFVLSFTKGIPELLGFPETILQLMVEGLIFVLFFHSLFFIFKRKKVKGPGLIVNTFLIVIILISYFLTHLSTIKLILFIRKFGVYYLFFYALFNINITQYYKEKLIKLIIILFIIQIPAAFIKLIILGGTLEKIIGTMSIMEGSLATIMPVMAISYLISNYLEYKKMKDIILILLFIAIGLISNKLGILFYVVFLFLAMTSIFSKLHSDSFLFNSVFMRKVFINLFYVLIIFLAFISLNPRANPEHKVGGSIDIEYLIQYTEDYQTLKVKDSNVEGDGRFDAPAVALNRLEEGGLMNLLLGFGPGEIIKSSFTPYKNPLLEKYHIGYGGRIGLVWILMQIGFIGMIVFLLFHLVLLKKIWAIHNIKSTDQTFRVYVLTAIGFSIIYFLDFFTYSTEMIKNPGLAAVYYFTIYYILSEKNNLKEMA